MSEVLTRAEIEEKYKGGMGADRQSRLGSAVRVKSGVVICHSNNYEDFVRQMTAVEPWPRWSAELYLGELPEHILG